MTTAAERSAAGRGLVLDLFAGTGGATAAFRNAGWRVVAVDLAGGEAGLGLEIRARDPNDRNALDSRVLDDGRRRDLLPARAGFLYGLGTA